MATVYIPTFLPDRDTASQLYESFYGYSSPSLRVINGELDSSNINDFSILSYRNIQKRAFSSGNQVGGTATLDYFHGGADLPVGSGWFTGVTGNTGAQVADVLSRWVSVPGLAQKFYLPASGYVLFFWSVTWANDDKDSYTYPTTDDDRMIPSSHLALFIDGQPAPRMFGPTSPTPSPRDIFLRSPARSQLLYSDINKDGDGNGILRDRYKGRFWSCHYMTDKPLSPGYHEVSLRLCGLEGGKSSVKQTKIRARSMKYIYFRDGATF
tara:strand:+ start:718 stop:1518 length:801 start_codon:yes stop_codon:yes gene_type:complete